MKASNLRIDSRRLSLALCAILFTLLACVSERDVPLHGWWQERGPVVRHDTFPSDCTLCHLGDTWHELRDEFEFDHELETQYPLEGAHADAKCLRCHNDRGPVQLYVRRGCYGCHRDTHRGQLGDRCDICHSESDWRPVGQVAEHRRTRFPLTGAHLTTACWRCHPGAATGEFSPTDDACVTCHANELARVSDPDHEVQGWTRDCDRCHFPTTWDGAGFQHSRFPLIGGHDLSDCSSCHLGGVFEPLTKECVTCHLDNYLATREPDHQLQGYPDDCVRCHDVFAWEGADFDHVGAATGCVACHLIEYQTAADPEHSFHSFPTQCEFCHDTLAWAPAELEHPWPRFEIHLFMPCFGCHTTLGDFSTFDCIDCHAHTRRLMGTAHKGIPDYTWENLQCLACHPDGVR